MKRVLGKRAIVTGGTRGIGKEIARLFVLEGAEVIIFGTHVERGEAAASEIGATFYQVDVSNHADVEKKSTEILAKWESVDLLVNCAGITKDGLFMRMKEEDWDSVIDTNLKSVYNVTYAFLRGMIKARKGRVINVTSVIGGVIGNPGQVSYAASKAGMVGFTKSLAKEIAVKEVTVNCIAPGFIETDMTLKLSEEQRRQILDKVPAKKLGSPSDIAYAALFLGSDESGYITGQTLVVDGGMTA